MKAPSNRALVGDALDVLFRVLRPFVEERMEAAYGDDWLKESRRNLHNKPPERWDVSDLFTLIYFRYAQAFRSMGHEGRSWVSILKEVRKRWAHQGELTLDETRRTLETAVLVLEAVGAPEEAERIRPRVLKLMERQVGRSRTEAGAADETSATNVAPAAGGGDGELEGGDSLLDRGIRRFRRLRKRTSVEPLEVRRDLLDAVERAVRPYADGRSFNRIIVHVVVPDGRARLLYEAALGGQDEAFDGAVRRRLSEARLPASPRLNVSWQLHRSVPRRLAGRFGDRPHYVELDRRVRSTKATLVVVHGAAGRERYAIKSGSPTTIGRLVEVMDEKGRLVRRNTVAFCDYETPDLDEADRGVLQTVSRAHACIRYDEADGAFRLYDEQSTWGTSVVREGYPVPIQVKQRPVALQDGDLLYFGKACVRFHLGRVR